MPNTYFQFKQFTIHQDKCAMKVCTDACLLGAIVAEEIADNRISAENILDIGCGTGLLSLMLAQKTTAVIDAVEIDPDACTQAAENAANSPWSQKISVFNNDILEFNKTKEYDCIISNPPFFEGDLKSIDGNKNAAKHDTALTLQQLLGAVKTHLKADGFFCILLPYHRAEYCMATAAKNNLYVSRKILVKQSAKHGYFRTILIFSSSQTVESIEEIIIKDDNGNYSERFSSLLKDYYLYL